MTKPAPNAIDLISFIYKFKEFISKNLNSLQLSNKDKVNFAI